MVKLTCGIFVLTGFLHHVTGVSRPSTIVLENNQYKNVVVAIHESIPEDAGLIDTLKVFIYFYYLFYTDIASVFTLVLV